jgi:hypothetical protein
MSENVWLTTVVPIAEAGSQYKPEAPMHLVARLEQHAARVQLLVSRAPDMCAELLKLED